MQSSWDNKGSKTGTDRRTHKTRLNGRLKSKQSRIALKATRWEAENRAEGHPSETMQPELVASGVREEEKEEEAFRRRLGRRMDRDGEIGRAHV